MPDMRPWLATMAGLSEGEQAALTESSQAVSSCERVWRAGSLSCRDVNDCDTRLRKGVVR